MVSRYLIFLIRIFSLLAFSAKIDNGKRINRDGQCNIQVTRCFTTQKHVTINILLHVTSLIFRREAASVDDFFRSSVPVIRGSAPSSIATWSAYLRNGTSKVKKRLYNKQVLRGPMDL